MKNVAGHLSNERSPKAILRPTQSSNLTPSTVVRPVVLLALFEQERPTESLLRALALSCVLDAELQVIGVLPEPTRVSAIFPQNHIMNATQMVESTLHANRSTYSWLRACLGPEEPAVGRFTIVHGNFVDQVTHYAADLEAILIVVSSGERGVGGAVASLACRCGVSVLVARQPSKAETIIAATDLESEDYPVLHRAAELGQKLDAPVIALHNVDPLSVVVATAVARPATVSPGEPVQESASSRLAEISKRLPVEARPVIRNDPNPIAAILGEARERNADLLVVGTRRRSWFDRLIGNSVAAQVVDRTKRSVLVTPLDDVGPLATAPATGR